MRGGRRRERGGGKGGEAGIGTTDPPQSAIPSGSRLPHLSQARWPRRAMVWMVFPRPISSARMPFSLFSSMATSQSSPMCWYSRSLCLRRNGTFVFTWGEEEEGGRRGRGEGREGTERWEKREGGGGGGGRGERGWRDGRRGREGGRDDGEGGVRTEEVKREVRGGGGGRGRGR